MYGTLCVRVAGLIRMVGCVYVLLGLICMVGCVCMLLD